MKPVSYYVDLTVRTGIIIIGMAASSYIISRIAPDWTRSEIMLMTLMGFVASYAAEHGMRKRDE